jgi:F0F1-type ATP synthase membrane subunit a
LDPVGIESALSLFELRIRIQQAECSKIPLKLKTRSVALFLIAINAGTNLASAAPVEGEHGLPQQAVEIARPLGFPITNSMVVTWIVAAGLIVFARVATRGMKQIPDGAQNFLEWHASN